MRFMNLTKEYSGEDSRYLVLPIEYEKKLTYGKGASKGSKEIIKASKHIEYYDEQFNNEPFIKGIKTNNRLKLNNKKPEYAIKKIIEEIGKNKEKFIISIGGDHSITIGTIKGLERKEKDFSVIILDAHTDYFYSWNNSQYNHRCTSYKATEKHQTLLVGVRSMDVDEKKLIGKNKQINMIKSYNYNKKKLMKELKKLHKKVYVSIDVDFFDQSFIRNTGTPEPGGFFWNKTIEILKAIFQAKEVIGADIVEFAPNKNYEAEAYTLAKLAYKIMSLKFNQIK